MLILIPKSRLFLKLALLLSICYLLFFFRIGAHDLWSPDEPRYAQVAREMLETGDWIVPHLNGEVYQEKPPLYFWLVALLSKPFGDVNETTARFPSASAATLVVLATYIFGSRIMDDRAAFLGSLIMATSAQFFWIARIGVIDMLLTLSILGSLICFFYGFSAKRPPLYVAGFVFLVPAALSKGPVGIAVPAVAMLVFLAVEIILRREGSRREAGQFIICAIIGLAVVALFVVPWWRAAYERSGGDYGSLSLLKQQTEGRMFQSYSHRQPVYYYFVQILWQFMPWTVFLPLVAYVISKKGSLRENQELRFLLVWFLSVFAFFALISGKRSQYILPSFPAAGLLFGWALVNSGIGEGRLRERREFSWPLLLLAMGFAAGLAGMAATAFFRARELFPAALMAAVFFAAALIALIFYCQSRPPKTSLTLVIVVAVLSVAILFGYAAPLVDRYNSARAFCSEVLAAMRNDDDLFFYRVFRPNVHFYMHRRMPRLESGEDVQKALYNSSRVFLVLQDKDKDALKLDPAYDASQIAAARVGSRNLICVVVQSALSHHEPTDAQSPSKPLED